MAKYIDDSYKLYIGGKWVDASDAGTFETYCPANGERLATCAEATEQDVDHAVKAAWKDVYKRQILLIAVTIDTFSHARKAR